MTTQETIDQAARVLREHWSLAQETGEPDEADCCAQVLADAGLLSTSAERCATWNDLCRKIGDAEAERDQARATIARLNRRAQVQEAAINELASGTGRGNRTSREIWERCHKSHDQVWHDTEAERDAAVAKLDQVRAAMHEWAGSHHSGYYDEAQDDAWRVVAPILDGERMTTHMHRAERAEATIQRVRDLHQPSPPDCTDPRHDGRLCPCGGVVCESCGDDYPCPTIRALDQEAQS